MNKPLLFPVLSRLCTRIAFSLGDFFGYAVLKSLIQEFSKGVGLQGPQLGQVSRNFQIDKQKTLPGGGNPVAPLDPTLQLYIVSEAFLRESWQRYIF